MGDGGKKSALIKSRRTHKQSVCEREREKRAPEGSQTRFTSRRMRRGGAPAILNPREVRPLASFGPHCSGAEGGLIPKRVLLQSRARPGLRLDAVVLVQAPGGRDVADEKGVNRERDS